MNEINNNTLFKISYGVYILTARQNGFDNGCVINSCQMITDSGKLFAIAINKNNLTHDMVKETGIFNISILTKDSSFDLIKHFGYQSGKNVDKFEKRNDERSSNGICYIKETTNSYISFKVTNTVDFKTHTLFIATVVEAKELSSIESMTYDYYFSNVKPNDKEKGKGYRCKICGYVYDKGELPLDFICPICKHGYEDFEKIKEE